MRDQVTNDKAVNGLRIFLCLSLMALPFELSISELAHGLFKSILPSPELLLHPLIIVIVLLSAGSIITLGDITRVDKVVLACLLLIAFPSFTHICLGNVRDLNFLILGVGSMMLGTILVHTREISLINRMLVVGSLLWCIVVIAIYLLDGIRLKEAYPWIASYSLDQYILAARYPESISMTLFYPYIVGNWNKASNYIELMSLLTIASWCRKDISPKLAGITLIALSAIHILSFSRGGMLVALFAAIVLALSAIKYASQQRILIFSAILMALPFLVTILLPATRASWFDMASVTQRISLASQGIESENQGIPRLLIGAGSGYYGMQNFGNVNAGTHNMFIDAFLSGGVIDLAGLATLFFYPLQFIARKKRESITSVIAGLAILSVIILADSTLKCNF